MMGALGARHALIIGGGTGIGAAIARALAGAGVLVSIAVLRRTPLEDRFISPEEVAQEALWLHPLGADAINGQAISISGAVP